MSVWNKLKPVLKKNSNIDSLSSVLLLDDNTLIPHLLNNLEISTIQNALSEVLNFEIFDDKIYADNKIVASSKSYVIVKKNDKYLAFSTNPLSSLEIFKLRSATESNITSIGFISPGHKALNNNQGNKKETHLDSKKIVKSLFEKAVDLGVSDIHIAPRNSTHVGFKFRLDGMIVDADIADIDNLNYQSIAAEINSLFGIDIGKYNAIQEKQSETSKIDVFNYQQKSVNLRLQLSPLQVKFKTGSQKGKSIPNYVIRLLSATSFKSLNDIGLTELQTQEITGFCKHNNSGIFIAGPTGSGKTTLAYAILAEIHNQRKGISVMSVEDPVEVNLPNTQQIPITETDNHGVKSGLGFAQAIKAILRSDPDVVFCGEIRDKSTAYSVCDIKQIGNSILTTMHADKSFDIIDRMKSTSNIESFAIPLDIIAKTISVIVMPRLLRKVCQHCCAEVPVEQNSLFKKYSNSFDIRTTPIKQATSGGCHYCNETGYKGRTQVAEIFVIDNRIKQLIINNKSSEEIHTQALKNQKRDIYFNAIMLVKKGITTLEEITRVLPSKNNFGSEYESHHEADQI